MYSRQTTQVTNQPQSNLLNVEFNNFQIAVIIQKPNRKQNFNLTPADAFHKITS